MLNLSHIFTLQSVLSDWSLSIDRYSRIWAVWKGKDASLIKERKLDYFTWCRLGGVPFQSVEFNARQDWRERNGWEGNWREAFPPPRQFPSRLAVFFPFDSLDFLARATIVGKFSQSILRAIFSEQRIHIFLMHFSMSYQQPRLRAPLLLAPGDE